MATCANCGAQLADGIRFCGNCGAPREMPQQQAGVQYGQPQPQSPEGHRIVRYHRVFAFLRFLWLPVLVVMIFESSITSMVFGRMAGDLAYVGWKMLGIVWSVVSLVIAIRASKLRLPKTGTSVALSVLGLISAIFVNIVLVVAEFLGSRF